MRAFAFIIASLFWLLTACKSEPAIDFAQPSPSSAPDVQAFPKRHQGVYLLPKDTTYRLIITTAAIWTEELNSIWLDRSQLDSVKIPVAGRAMNVWYLTKGTRYRLRASRADALWLDRWERNTLCELHPRSGNQVRWYQGAYYLSHEFGNPEAHWEVQRLSLEGQKLSWQTLGRDTLRIAVLPAGVVKRMPPNYWLLNPTNRRQEHAIVSYAGLWQTERVLERQ